jgi:hypothetical protein
MGIGEYDTPNRNLMDGVYDTLYNGGMNKGNPRVILRMEPRLLALVAAEVERSKLHRKGQPHDRSTWIRQACIDRLKHSARSRGADSAELAELDAFPTNGV